MVYIVSVWYSRCRVRIIIFVSGYGNLTPKTNTGRICTIIYALIGIPLTLLWLSKIGSLLGHVVTSVYARVTRCRRSRRGSSASSSSRPRRPSPLPPNRVDKKSGSNHQRCDKCRCPQVELAGEKGSTYSRADFESQTFSPRQAQRRFCASCQFGNPPRLPQDCDVIFHNIESRCSCLFEGSLSCLTDSEATEVRKRVSSLPS